MKKKVIIVGGGFAGLQLVRNLDKSKFDVLLIDRLNHHQFQPLFYQVATSQIEPSSISFPFRNVFRNNESVQIRLAEVIRISPADNEIETTAGFYHYDYLILATGCKTNFFNNNSIEKNALPLKTTYDAIAIRNHIITVFEKIISAESIEKNGLFNLIIVGAGPTGVELAGAFAEIKKEVLPKDYPGIDFSAFTIYLIEGSEFTLNNMSNHAKTTSYKYLIKMGVKILTKTFVTNYDGETALLSNGNRLPSSTLIWAAGVTGNRIAGLDENVWTTNNRIAVDRYNQVKGSENIFAVGDIAYMTTPKYPMGHPQLANVAIHQAKNLARNLNRKTKAKSLKEFEYFDLGTMATVGKHKALVDFPFIRFSGYMAWITWMFLHLMLILSVRNKLIIFINWVLGYLTKDSSLRLILQPAKPVSLPSDSNT